MLLYVLSQSDISDLWEQSTRDLFWKTFLLVVGVADGHVQDCLLQALKLSLGVRLDHEGGPSLKALGCQTWNIGSFLEIVQLDEVMLCPDLTE